MEDVAGWRVIGWGSVGPGIVRARRMAAVGRWSGSAEAGVRGAVEEPYCRPRSPLPPVACPDRSRHDHGAQGARTRTAARHRHAAPDDRDAGGGHRRGTARSADLAATTRDLLAHLERHLSSEEAVLVAGNTSDHARGRPRGPAGGTSGSRCPRTASWRWTGCPPASSSMPPSTAWCGCVAASRSDFARAGTRTRSGGGWTAPVPGTTVSTTCRTARTGGVCRSPAGGRCDQRRLS